MELPALGQKLDFRILQGPLGGQYSTYVSEVNNHFITLARPSVGDILLPLTVGETVQVEYAIKGLARLSFLSKVTAMIDDLVPLVQVSVPEKEEVERFQQRDFVRLDASLNLHYYVVSTPDSAHRTGGVHKSVTRDISGNGAQIICPEPYPLGTQLDVHLEVGERTIHAVGEVIRKVEKVAEREYLMGLRFVGLDERDREVIIRYIFSEQRERRKKGLL